MEESVNSERTYTDYWIVCFGLSLRCLIKSDGRAHLFVCVLVFYSTFPSGGQDDFSGDQGSSPPYKINSTGVGWIKSEIICDVIKTICWFQKKKNTTYVHYLLICGPN